MLCNCICKWCWYDRFHCYRILWHRTFLYTSCTNVVKKQNSDFISTDEFVRTIRTLHCNTNTVCIRVSCKHQVCASLLCKVQSLLKCLENLRIRITTCCEISIWILLLRNNCNVCNSNVFQYLCDRNKSRTIEWTIYKLQSCCLAKSRANLSVLDCIIKSSLTIIAHKTNQSLFNALCKWHVFCTSQNIRLLNLFINNCCRIICHLTSIRTICFISIIFSRIMRCCYHNTCITIIITCCKWKSRYRHQCIIDPNLDSIRCQHTCRILRKYITFNTAVITDCYCLRSTLRLYPVRQPLCSLTYNIDIHPVRTCSKNTSKSCSSKLKSNCKTLLDLLVIFFNSRQFRLQIRIL